MNKAEKQLMNTRNALRKMYQALHIISNDYQTTEQLRKNSKKDYGLDYTETLEMAYDNIQVTAKVALKGFRKSLLSPPAKPTTDK